MAHPIVTSSPDILSGTPVFAGTRVPVQALIDYLEGGERSTTSCWLPDRPAGADRGLPGGGRRADDLEGVVRVLLDDCVDRRLAGDIQGHDTVTVPDAGWAALKNGDLLARAQREFDVFVTVDRNLSFQQDLSRVSMAVIVLRARSNRIRDLRGLIPRLLAALPAAKRGEVTWIGSEHGP